ncbi:MAG: hypothetical protein JO112_23590 [Planctomycetes bacterium]|nr:hypothetical protein [Planctomycetota bacterium]
MSNGEKRAPEHSGTDFAGWFSNYKNLVLTLLSVSSLPPLTSLLLKIGPPWPGDAAAATVCIIVNMVCLLYIYNSRAHHESNVRRLRRFKVIAVGFLSSLLIYMLLKVFLCYNAPDWRHQVAGGLILQEDIRGLLRVNPQLNMTDLLQASDFNPEHLWVSWTVRLVQWLILVNWVFVYVFLSAAVGYSVLPGAVKRTKKPAGSMGPQNSPDFSPSN